MNTFPNPSFISLFSGAGGLDLGLERSGWKGRFATDIDPDAIATLKKNRGKRICGGRFGDHVTIAQHDVRKLTAKEILSASGAKM